MANPQAINGTSSVFTDLCARLTKAHSREETAKHATAAPIFEVRKVSIIPGFEKKFAKGLCLVTRRGEVILDADAAFKEVTGFDAEVPADSQDMIENEPVLAEDIQDLKAESFKTLSEKDKWDILSSFEGGFDVTGYTERAEIVSVHLTPEAAETAKQRTRLEAGEKAYIFVGSKWNEPEYTALIAELTDRPSK